jgi:hypothetical protein
LAEEFAAAQTEVTHLGGDSLRSAPLIFGCPHREWTRYPKNLIPYDVGLEIETIASDVLLREDLAVQQVQLL